MLVRNHARVELHLDGLGVAVVAADRVVGRVGRAAARVADGGVDDARNALVALLGMPVAR